jgi:hypothetical protein
MTLYLCWLLTPGLLLPALLLLLRPAPARAQPVGSAITTPPPPERPDGSTAMFELNRRALHVAGAVRSPDGIELAPHTFALQSPAEAGRGK